MEKPEVDNASAGLDDGSQLNRNRSFKSKQLVRSQAIRESHSPPRTISPYPTSPVNESKASEEDKIENGANVPEAEVDRKEEKKQPIEIQITTGGWEEDDDSSQRRRSKRWVGSRHSDTARCLLNNPGLACVCGACECSRCRSQRTKHNCPVKQDSGIACSVDCPDCDYDHLSANGVRKTASFEEQQYYRGPDRRDNRQRSYWFTRSDSDIAEPSWAELVSFMKNTLNKNAKDRETLLRLERELLAFVEDTNRCIVKFPTMTSYGRMLVHRCAALFRLAHRCDVASRFTVLVSKTGTSCGRIPCTSFAQWCTVTFPKSPQRNEEEIAAKSILKRSVSGEGDGGAAEGSEGGEGGARSLQQRERDYERVRRRIFSTEKDVQDSEWPWLTTGPIKLLTPEPGRNKLIKVQSLESRGAQDARTRGPVSKSHSLDGYGAEPPQPRLLSRQGDLASSSWRLSPSSSGYKTLSLRSTDSVTPSPTGCPSPDAAAPSTAALEADAARAPVVCCVTDMSSVPPGALVIHPQTGKPLTHPDGSIYYFDPANPPIIQDETVYLQNGHQQNKNAEKRRGRLEKQHSFIDNDCDCPPEECQEKCCCDCPEQEICTKCPIEQLTLSPHSSKPNSMPTSPAKRPEPTTLKNTPEPANQRPTYDNPPNQRPPYDSPANHRAYDNATHQRLHTNNQNSPTRRQNYNPLQRYDVANQRYARYESQNQIIEVSSRMEVTNQRVPVEVSASQRLEAANQRQGLDVAANQRYDQRFEPQRPPSYEQSVRSETYKGVEGIQYGQNFVQYRNDEITSPPQASHYPTPELDMQAMIAQKMTPVPMPEPNIRPMSIAANMMYPAVHQGYQYVNACRLEQPIHPLYQQQLVQQVPQLMSEEHKQAAAHPESTFRIDPSYPYATDFNAACGACGDPNAIQHQPRSVNVGYGQMEMPPTVVPQPYPMHNVMPQIPPYPYQDAMQWGVAPGAGVAAGGHKLLPDVYPVLCPVYPPYNMLYPQVIPQPYQICPPVYPVVDKQPEVYQPRNNYQRQSKRSSVSNSARTTPQTPDDKKVPYDDKNRESINNRDIAANNRENRNASDATNIANDANRANDSTNRENREIDNARVVEQNSGAYASRPAERSNDIAESIAQIKQQMAQNKENSRGGRGDEWRRRNCGGGILGSYPVNNFNGRVMGRPANEEAHINPALYNSIRNMQAKQNYQQQQDRRVYELMPNRFDNRYDNRRRFDRDDRTASLRVQDVRLQRERPDVMRNRPGQVALPLRPPYLFRQVTPNTWNRRSTGIIPPVMNHPRRPHPDRNPRR